MPNRHVITPGSHSCKRKVRIMSDVDAETGHELALSNLRYRVGTGVGEGRKCRTDTDSAETLEETCAVVSHQPGEVVDLPELGMKVTNTATAQIVTIENQPMFADVTIIYKLDEKAWYRLDDDGKEILIDTSIEQAVQILDVRNKAAVWVLKESDWCVLVSHRYQVDPSK